MRCLLVLTLILCILGIVVQYTNFGDLKEKKAPISVHFSADKEGNKQQYIELLTQVDKLLLNKKKIWAVFFLCFSIPRNAIILFYDTEKSHKVGYMRILKVIGFIWICFDITFYIALKTYPINYNEYPSLTTNSFSTFLLSGIIFGFSMVYFYSGFSTMYDILQSIFIKQQKFNPFLFIIRCYIFYVIPIAFTIAIIVTFLPYMGQGPIYSLVIQDIFIKSCSEYWWTNILLISNYYPTTFS